MSLSPVILLVATLNAVSGLKKARKLNTKRATPHLEFPVEFFWPA